MLWNKVDVFLAFQRILYTSAVSLPGHSSFGIFPRYMFTRGCCFCVRNHRGGVAGGRVCAISIHVVPVEFTNRTPSTFPAREVSMARSQMK